MDDKKNVVGYTFKTPKIVEKFYYTTHYPSQWSSGPTFHYWGKNGAQLSSIEEAKEMAEKKYVGGYGNDHCSTTYGVIIECTVKPANNVS